MIPQHLIRLDFGVAVSTYEEASPIPPSLRLSLCLLCPPDGQTQEAGIDSGWLGRLLQGLQTPWCSGQRFPTRSIERSMTVQPDDDQMRMLGDAFEVGRPRLGDWAIDGFNRLCSRRAFDPYLLQHGLDNLL